MHDFMPYYYQTEKTHGMTFVPFWLLWYGLTRVFFLAAGRDMLFQRPFLPKRPCLRNCLMELYLSNNVIEDLVVTPVSFQGKTTVVCSWDLK